MTNEAKKDWQNKDVSYEKLINQNVKLQNSLRVIFLWCRIFLRVELQNASPTCIIKWKCYQQYCNYKSDFTQTRNNLAVT